MTKTKIDYSKIIIYKIICNNINITELYVGSTTNFRKRKVAHKSNTNNISSKSYYTKIYQTIRDNGGWDAWTMIEIEKFPCVDGNEARARERYYFDTLNASLNTVRPFISDKERHVEAHEQKKRSKEKMKNQNWYLFCIRKKMCNMRLFIKYYERYHISFQFDFFDKIDLPCTTLEEFKEALAQLNILLIEELKNPTNEDTHDEDTDEEIISDNQTTI